MNVVDLVAVIVITVAKRGETAKNAKEQAKPSKAAKHASFILMDYALKIILKLNKLKIKKLIANFTRSFKMYEIIAYFHTVDPHSMLSTHDADYAMDYLIRLRKDHEDVKFLMYRRKP